MKYRLACVDDIKQLISINNRCLSEHYSLSTWKTLLSKSVGIGNFVAVNDDNVVGYILLSHQSNDAVYLRGLNSNCHTITSLAVLPKYRKKGIATELMNLAIDAAKKMEYKPIEIRTRVSNTAALGLYHKLGFVDKFFITGYYSNPDEDALVLFLF